MAKITPSIDLREYEGEIRTAYNAVIDMQNAFSAMGYYNPILERMGSALDDYLDEIRHYYDDLFGREIPQMKENENWILPTNIISKIEDLKNSLERWRWSNPEQQTPAEYRVFELLLDTLPISGYIEKKEEK